MDNLVSILDGYAGKGGHHLNMWVFRSRGQLVGLHGCEVWHGGLPHRVMAQV